MNLMETRETLLTRFTQFLASRLTRTDGPPVPLLDEGTSLIRSGLVDSLALVDLLLWIEAEIGTPLSEAAIGDLKRADTVGAIGQFIAAVRARARPDLPRRAEHETPSAPFEGTVVTYQPELRTEVLTLQVHHWGDDHRCNEQYLRWKYEENPYEREPLIYLVRVAGRAVGMRGFYGSEWELAHGQRLRAVCAGDLVVHPAYRNRGIIPRLMEYATADLKARGFRYLFSLSAGLVTHVASLALGWRGIGPLDLLVWRRPRVRRVLAAAADRLHRRAVSNGGPFERFDELASRRGGAVTLESPAPDALAELVSRIGHDGRLRHVRTPEYFAWRLGNPRSVYRVLTWREPRLEGYLILQASTHRPGRARIVDWEANTASIRAALLRAAVEWGNFDELATWSGTLPEDARHLLRETGFTRVSASGGLRVAQHTMLAKDLAATDPEGAWMLNGRSVLDLNRWDVRMLYSDEV
jgi:GNAT superfamily N-acetyltransferase/acyl carrier protein